MGNAALVLYFLTSLFFFASSLIGLLTALRNR